MTARLVQMAGAVVDLNYRIREVPPPGGEAIVHGLEMQPGGGFNAMVAARRAGMAVAYGGVLGQGPFAEVVAAGLRAEGIATLARPVPGRDQGLCTVLIDDAGERTFIARESAEGHVDAAHLARVAAGLRPDDWLLVSGYALLYAGSGPALAGWLPGRAARLPLVIDPCPLVAEIPAGILDPVVRAAAWVSANAAEARVLSGLADPAAACTRLAQGRPGGAVVRVGAQGCFIAPAGGIASHLPGFAVKAVDTNGAGDAHIGSFVAALAAGAAPADAARLANAAAALSTTRHGSATAPTLAETRAFLAL